LALQEEQNDIIVSENTTMTDDNSKKLAKVIQLDLAESGLKIDDRCDRCYDNRAFRMGYCHDCLDDFISRNEAAKILKISTMQVDRVAENHPDKIRLYEYGSQVRLSRGEVTGFANLEVDMSEAVKAAWSDHFLQCRICGTTEILHYGGGYCEDCFPTTTEAAVIEGYIDGENLAEVGIRLGFSRERARQFFEKAIKIEAERTDSNNMELVAKEFKKHLKTTNKQNRARLKFKDYIDDNYQTIIKTITKNNILSTSGLLKEFNLPANAVLIIESDYPEILEIIAKNEKRWAWDYDQCRMCGTKEKKHKVYGFCEDCYWKSDEWKARQNKYRENNVDKLREQQREYQAEYNKRPEVIERLKKRHDATKYDGNRDTALEQSNYQCADCGISQDDHHIRYRKDLYVYHIDGDPKNNEISNLMPLCMSCSVKRTSAKR
jgi:hypothetical protein